MLEFLIVGGNIVMITALFYALIKNNAAFPRVTSGLTVIGLLMFSLYGFLNGVGWATVSWLIAAMIWTALFIFRPTVRSTHNKFTEPKGVYHPFATKDIFDKAEEVIGKDYITWLQTPNRALDNKKPIVLIYLGKDKKVEQLLNRMEHGLYS